MIWCLQQEGVRDNHKRLYRLYRADGLAVRRQRPKQPAPARVPLAAPTRLIERWSMDFRRDTPADGRAIRLFTLVDDCTREGPELAVDFRLAREQVVAVLDTLARTRGVPRTIVVDNGAGVSQSGAHTWAQQQQYVGLQFIRPGKPTENAFIESFNGGLRDECQEIGFAAERTLPLGGWDRHTGAPKRPLGAEQEQCVLSYPAGQGGLGVRAAYLTGGGAARRIPVDSTWRLGAWHTVEIQVFPDGTCGYRVDGAPVWRTDAKVPLQESYRIHLTGNSAGTTLLVGPLEVWQGVRRDLDWSPR